MSNLIDFLLTRIAEDETEARAAGRAGECWWTRTEPRDRKIWGAPDNRAPVAEAINWQGSPHIARHDPARVLAECAAKRATVNMHSKFNPESNYCQTCRSDYGDSEWFPCPTLRALASVYVAHDEFRPEWAT